MAVRRSRSTGQWLSIAVVGVFALLALLVVPARRVQAAVRIPVFCIGGIKRANLEAVLAAGARRVAIVSEMLGAADIAGYAREVKAALRAAAGA